MQRKNSAKLTLTFNGPDNQAEMRAFTEVFRRCFNGPILDDPERDKLTLRAAKAILALVKFENKRT